MRLCSDSLVNGEPIPERHAAGRLAADGGVTFSDNVSPHLAWADLPAGTKVSRMDSAIHGTCTACGAKTAAPKLPRAEYPVHGNARAPCQLFLSPTRQTFGFNEERPVRIEAAGLSDCTIAWVALHRRFALPTG